MNVSKGREELNNSLSKSIIGDVSWVYGVWNMDQYFLYLLSLRSILWWADKDKEIILPDADPKIQYTLRKFKDNLLFTLDLSDSQVSTGDFKKLSNPNTRSPYMRTPYYFDDSNYILNIQDLLEKVRFLGDKVGLADFLKNNGFDKFLPSNTEIFTKWNNFDKAVKEAKIRFQNKQSFIIKAGEWASWENMVLVKFFENKATVYHHQALKWKTILTFEQLLEEIDVAIPISQRIKKWWFDSKWYNKNLIKEQFFLVQDLIDVKKYKEKSINFYIWDKIFPTAYGTNIAVWWVHKGNIEEQIPDWLLQKFLPILEKIKEYGYYWPIGFDFFLQDTNLDIKIIEANTRFTAPISPSMLVYKLERQWKIPSWWTWKLIQKFDTTIDLTDINSLKKYNLVESLLKEEDIKSAKFLAYSPVFSKKYQSIIILWPTQETISELENKIYSIISWNGKY